MKKTYAVQIRTTQTWIDEIKTLIRKYAQNYTEAADILKTEIDATPQVCRTVTTPYNSLT